jgi:acyl carrier protein
MTQQEDLDTGSVALDTDPRGKTEITVGRLFAEIIGISGLSRTASFFDLGLNSLSVAVACARLEQETGIRVGFSQLFRTPTVAQLAAWIDAAGDQPGAGPGPVSPDTLVAITPRQSRTVPRDIVVIMAWWFDGEIDDKALESAASDVHRRHQALHARYLDGPELGLAEVPGDPGQAEFHRLPGEDTDAAALDALLRALGQPLRLDQGEIWRSAILRGGESGRTLFGAAIHHAGFDGRSLSILTADLSRAYSARTAGAAPQWPGRVASLAEMSADYRRQLAAQDADALRDYWRNELRELPVCHLSGRVNAAGPPIGPAVERAFIVRKQDQLPVWEDYTRAYGVSASVGMAAAYMQAIIRVGGPADFGLMVGLANWSGEVIDRTITNRVGNIFLRPNGPSRSAPHMLARMRDAYHDAMAARDVLIDPGEYEGIFTDERTGGMKLFQEMPHMVYNTYPSLSLGAVTGIYAPELRVWDGCGRELMVEAEPVAEGTKMHVIVRTDRYDASLADRLSQHFMDIVSAGPERLEAETAR